MQDKNKGDFINNSRQNNYLIRSSMLLDHCIKMNTALIIGMVILTGVSIGWVFHHRSMRHMKPILTRLAAEKNGTVESPSLFLMPRLRFSHSDTEVEVSSASTGIAGESVHYTYAVFKGLDLKSFEFRILPKSLQTIGDKWIGLKKPISIGVDKLEKRLSIYTNNEPLLKAILSERIQADLLSWAEQKTNNRINDIGNYDDNLIFAVTGTLKNHAEYRLFLDTACRFYDAVTNVVRNYAKVPNDV